jgi:glycosyltransferase involved in cell wall biosynthesis
MNFDLFIFSFLKKKYLGKIAVRTIFFRPFVHFPNINLNDKIKNFIKELVLKYVLVRNHNLEKIFILNDNVAVSLLNNIFFTLNKSNYKFHQLPDPVKKSKKVITNRIKNIDSVINFLVIGTIDEKKNVIALLEAIQSISNTSKQFKIKLTIAGKVANHFKQELIDKCLICRDSFEIEIIDKFLSETEFENNMEISECVFMAYK